MHNEQDYFEKYLHNFPDVPSLVLVRSVECKNFPVDFLKPPILDLCCGDGFFSATLGLKNISGCDISQTAIKLAQEKGIYSELKVCDVRKMPYEDNSFNFLRLILPLQVRKIFWRMLLKKYYLDSTPLENGGELVIIAKNEK